MLLPSSPLSQLREIYEKDECDTTEWHYENKFGSRGKYNIVGSD